MKDEFQALNSCEKFSTEFLKFDLKNNLDKTCNKNLNVICQSNVITRLTPKNSFMKFQTSINSPKLVQRLNTNSRFLLPFLLFSLIFRKNPHDQSTKTVE